MCQAAAPSPALTSDVYLMGATDLRSSWRVAQHRDRIANTSDGNESGPLVQSASRVVFRHAKTDRQCFGCRLPLADDAATWCQHLLHDTQPIQPLKAQECVHPQVHAAHISVESNAVNRAIPTRLPSRGSRGETAALRFGLDAVNLTHPRVRSVSLDSHALQSRCVIFRGHAQRKPILFASAQPLLGRLSLG